jgi:hypothetical protein
MNQLGTMGDFKVGVSVGVYCTKCTLNTGVNTNFEITQCRCSVPVTDRLQLSKPFFFSSRPAKPNNVK